MLEKVSGTQSILQHQQEEEFALVLTTSSPESEEWDEFVDDQ